MGKIRVYFDNTIFFLQKIGGISVVFSEIIKRLKNVKKIEMSLIINRDTNDNLMYKSIKYGLRTLREMIFSECLLPFMPLFVRLPAGLIYHSCYN